MIEAVCARRQGLENNGGKEPKKENEQYFEKGGRCEGKGIRTRKGLTRGSSPAWERQGLKRP